MRFEDWKDLSGAVVDLTGYTAKLAVSASPGGAVDIEVAGTLAWVAGVSNSGEFVVPDTATVDWGELMHYEVVLVPSGGDDISLLKGVIDVSPRVSVS